MTPTLSGRMQTRLFALVVLGTTWTLIIGPFIATAADLPLVQVYQGTFLALYVVLLAGLAWELLYHGLQQFRWEKDWPTLLGLLTGVPEGLLAFRLTVAVGASLGLDVPGRVFLVHFATTWVVIFLFLNGPMRVLSIRWRYNGGRLR